MLDNLPLTFGGLIAIVTLIGAVLMAYRWGMAEISAAEDRALTAVTLAKASADIELKNVNDRFNTLQLDLVKNYATYGTVDKTAQRIELAIEKLGTRFDAFGAKFNDVMFKLVDKLPPNG